MIAIYGSASERLRAVNVFDGLQYFRGSAVTLNPDGFRIPSSNIDGRMAIVAWEGDPGNSTALNGFSEAWTSTAPRSTTASWSRAATRRSSRTTAP